MPLRATVWVPLSASLSVTIKLADREPPAAGVKVTLALHFEPGATGLEHVSLSAKSSLFVPPLAIFVMVRFAMPVFEIVTD